MKAIRKSYREVLSPRAIIEVNGTTALDVSKDIISFEYIEHSSKISELKLTVANKNYKYTNDVRFKEQSKYRAVFGYIGDYSKAQVFVFSNAKPTFSEDMPTIEVTCFDLRAELNKSARPFSYDPFTSSSAIAQKVAKAYGLKPTIDESKDARKERRVRPAGMTDLQYLALLADKLNYEFWVTDKELHFEARKYGNAPEMEFVFYTDRTGTLLSFTPEVDVSKPQGLAVAAVDTKNGNDSSVKGKSKGPFTAVQSGEKTFFTGQVKMELVTLPSAESSKAVVQKIANAQKQKVNMNAVKAKASVIGTPRLRARSVVRFVGVGQYSGNWYIAECKHKIDAEGGYTTELTLNKNGLLGKKGDGSNNKGADNGSAKKPVPVTNVISTGPGGTVFGNQVKNR